MEVDIIYSLKNVLYFIGIPLCCNNIVVSSIAYCELWYCKYLCSQELLRISYYSRYYLALMYSITFYVCSVNIHFIQDSG